MLYVSTRDKKEAYTSQRAAAELRAPDGGMFLPFSIVPFTREELEDLGNIPFNDCLASIVNRFFGTRFSGWDMNLGIGRHPVRLVALNNRITAGECWHNPQWHFPGLVENLGKMILRGTSPQPCTGGWLETGLRVCVITAVFSQLLRQGIVSADNKIDVSMVSGDLSCTVSTWIARAMGLPIKNIIICCNENSALWDLFYHGQFRTDTVSKPTQTPEADVAQPQWLEALIALTCGQQEVELFLEASRKGSSYFPSEGMLDSLRRGIHVSVVSGSRVDSTIPNVYATNEYLLSPYCALCYAGLLDYRARTGESRAALLLSERGPRKDLETVASALNISSEELSAYLNKQ